MEEAEGFARMAREDSQRLEELKSMVKESRDDSCFLSFVKKRKHYISQNEIQLSVPFRGGGYEINHAFWLRATITKNRKHESVLAFYKESTK